MNGLEITKELKSDIETNQNQLKNAIRNHQLCVLKIKEDPDNIYLHKEVAKAEELIIIIGLEQKKLLERLRQEYKVYQKNIENNAVKNGLEERRFNLSKALNRARKQNISLVRSASANSFSDESGDEKFSPAPPSSISSSPELPNPRKPHDLSQTKFLGYFRLATHDAYRDMQNRRAERKRRSTANPHFLYGGRGWDFLSQPKRRRGQFLARPASPPTTRQASRRRQEARHSPPPRDGSPGADAPLPPIPANLPSGLIIERVGPGGGSPDGKFCISCKQPGALAICDTCANGFHASCHERMAAGEAGAPRRCPFCIDGERRAIGSLTVPSGMCVSYVGADLSEKLIEKKKLEERKESLSAELAKLRSRHSELTVSLRKQHHEQEELMVSQQTAEGRIQKILDFIEGIKNAKFQTDTQPEVKPDTECSTRDDTECDTRDDTECDTRDDTECDTRDDTECDTRDNTERGTQDDTECDTLDNTECGTRNDTECDTQCNAENDSGSKGQPESREQSETDAQS